MNRTHGITIRPAMMITILVVLLLAACFALNTSRAYAETTTVNWVTEKNSAGQYTSIKVDLSSMAAFDSFIVYIKKDGKEISMETTKSLTYDATSKILAYDSGEFTVEGFGLANVSGELVYHQFGTAEAMKFYTITIDKQGHGSDVKLNHIAGGSSVKTAVKNGYISTFDAGDDGMLMRYFENGDAFEGVALHPLSNYSDIDSLKAEACYMLPGGSGQNYTLGGDVKLYDIWFKVINTVDLTIQAPICGCSTFTEQIADDWGWSAQTNTPIVTIPSDKGYHYNATPGESAWWVKSVENDGEPFVGDFAGGNSYAFQACLDSDFGYVFPTDKDTVELTVKVNGQAIPRTNAYNGEMPYSFEVIDDGSVPLNINGNVTADHDWKDATCTEASTCKHCGETQGTALGHDWSGDYIVDKAATCTEAGSKHKECTRCHTSKGDEVIPALGHDWSGDYIIDKEATCTEVGSKHKECTRCHTSKGDEVIPALGHDWSGDYIIDKEATCTEAGSKHKECTRCHTSKGDEVIPALGHKEVVDPGTPATLTEDGMTAGSHCERCGEAMGAPTAISHPAGFKLSTTSYVYSGSAKKPSVTVTDAAGAVIDKANYAVSYKDNVKAGKASVVITFNSDFYTGTKTVNFTIKKAANTLTAKGKTATVKFKSLKKKNQTVKRAKAITYSKPQGTVTYKKISGNKKITINAKNGNITVKKKLKKGTYPVKIQVKAAGNANYNAGTKTVTVKIKVK